MFCTFKGSLETSQPINMYTYTYITIYKYFLLAFKTLVSFVVMHKKKDFTWCPSGQNFAVSFKHKKGKNKNKNGRKLKVLIYNLKTFALSYAGLLQLSPTLSLSSKLSIAIQVHKYFSTLNHLSSGYKGYAVFDDS